MNDPKQRDDATIEAFEAVLLVKYTLGQRAQGPTQRYPRQTILIVAKRFHLEPCTNLPNTCNGPPKSSHPSISSSPLNTFPAPLSKQQSYLSEFSFTSFYPSKLSVCKSRSGCSWRNLQFFHQLFSGFHQDLGLLTNHLLTLGVSI